MIHQEIVWILMLVQLIPMVMLVLHILITHLGVVAMMMMILILWLCAVHVVVVKMMVLVRYPDDPTPLIIQRGWEGEIALEVRGKNGFGYDPVFYLSEHRCTSAELSPKEKNLISHRGQALRELLRQLSFED